MHDGQISTFESPDPRYPNTRVADISDDGTVAIGTVESSFKMLPAVWHDQQGTILAEPKGELSLGTGLSVSRDGKIVAYMVDGAVFLRKGSKTERIFTPKLVTDTKTVGVNESGFIMKKLPPNDSFDVKWISPEGVAYGSRNYGEMGGYYLPMRATSSSTPELIKLTKPLPSSKYPQMPRLHLYGVTQDGNRMIATYSAADGEYPVILDRTTTRWIDRF